MPVRNKCSSTPWTGLSALLFLITIMLIHPFQASAAPAGAQIFISPVTGVAGQQADVVVSIAPSSEVAAYGLQIDYDKNVLEAVSITPKYGNPSETECVNDNNGCFQSLINAASGSFRAAWFDVSGGSHPVTTTTELFTVRFMIKSNIVSGSKLLSVDTTDPEKLNATDASGHNVSLLVTIGKSGLADLKSLSTSTGDLTPAFSTGIRSYHQNVANDKLQTTVTAVVYDPAATLKIRGITTASGTASGPIALATGDNTIPIEVKAADGSYTNLYTLIVNRAPSTNAQLSSLTTNVDVVNPQFSPLTTNYDLFVGTAIQTMTVTASVYDASSQLSVNGVSVNSGSESDAIRLNIGTNTISISVKAQDGVNTQTYTLNVHRAPSTNAQLSSLTTNVGAVNPQFSPLTTSYDLFVGTAIQTMTVTASVYDASSQLSVNGVSVNSGSESDAIRLNIGTNTISISVKAQDGVNTQTYTLNVRRAASNTSTTSSPTGTSAAPTTTQAPSSSSVVEIIIDGVKQDKLATALTEKNGEITTTKIILEQDKVTTKLENDSSKIITIPVSGNSDVVVGQLTGQLVKLMETKEAVLEIKTDRASYTLPALQMKIDDISAKLGSNVQLQDIIINVIISTPSKETVDMLQKVANETGVKLEVAPVTFEVTATLGDKKVEVERFNSYVERTITLPDGVDASQITTGVVLNPDGSFTHVPTKVIKQGNHDNAIINSLTNSTYTVVWSPRIFSDVSTHWSKQDVNDMASRLIIRGVSKDSFAPDEAITRAEFVTIMVRSLGIKHGVVAALPSDVRKDDWYTDTVATALSYQLIRGYEDGSFRPNQTITRAEAAVILNQASKLAKLNAFQSGDTTKLLQNFNDNQMIADWAKQAMAAAVSNGIIQGDQQKIMPQDNVTRAQTAAMMRRLLQKAGLINN
ncbi:cadherin-like beta sandwich domain-containing protein [Paenibacillus sp. WQ 127069]|uniref:Cadherin-like beta sandwich domain-containing protein n=1 Tax=Paenibacillus baimaensis TaxID=2982185 RepID=A0ABT2UBL0_9BACL|nr:cadherin-like beta sandwich domain-containing protein [Paenibacillus sp. WQ 127069]MCU6791571.1 cadherin-like beta sandwich domain-containing protein [Paenibacillus sp. WQ 127069]